MADTGFGMGVTVDRLVDARRRIKSRGESLQQGMTPTMDKAMKYVHSKVPPYPPPLPRQRYKRTGTLGRSIATSVKPFGDSVQGIIGSNVIYAPDVISSVKLPDGRGPQKPIHRGRWWTLQDVVKNLLPDVRKIFEGWINEILK